MPSAEPDFEILSCALTSHVTWTRFASVFKHLNGSLEFTERCELAESHRCFWPHH